MDNKTVSAVSQKRGNKQPKIKKKAQQQQQPLKVVYITNPIKFNATASEFRALVQELTGRDSDSSRFAAADGDGAQEEAEENNINVNPAPVKAAGSDPDPTSTTSGSYEDEYSPVMIDNFQGLAASSLWHGDIDVDVFKSLGAM